ncbi:MAG: tRNA (N6-threonylcarbamoyladenosine(37)-N6)-methyltransferase TrmO [FCB group bacterium]|nr:tRNA (N6-threonylcarbamoyladenosine(37)-N6)-methyltransferase TrmO [FCB group bacterium]
MEIISYKPIGIVHSPFKDTLKTPIQPRGGKNVEGQVEVFPEFAGGLKDLSGFSHIILICHFHLSKKFSLEVIPYMDTQAHGVFATRAPSRPNSIGLSTVRLVKVVNNILHIKDIDIINGTPLLDIKPYVSEFDFHDKIRKGWLEDNIHKLQDARDDNRFRE